jgi:predicted transcriptional regulator
MSIKTWSSEQELELVALYTVKEIKDVHELAEHFQKGYRSVISKLVQLKVYEKPQLEEEVKAQTVKTMLRDLESMLDIEIDGTNLNKKENLTKLVIALREKLSVE